MAKKPRNRSEKEVQAWAEAFAFTDRLKRAERSSNPAERQWAESTKAKIDRLDREIAEVLARRPRR